MPMAFPSGPWNGAGTEYYTFSIDPGNGLAPIGDMPFLDSVLNCDPPFYGPKGESIMMYRYLHQW